MYMYMIVCTNSCIRMILLYGGIITVFCYLQSPSHTSGLQSPGLVAGGTSTGATDGAMVDEDEHGTV